jgi:hypothetical protein
MTIHDNSQIRKLLVLLLQESNYDTIEATTGIEAVSERA